MIACLTILWKCTDTHPSTPGRIQRSCLCGWDTETRHQQLDRFPTEKTPPTDHAAVVDAYLEFADKGLSKTDIATRIGVGRGVMYAALDADPRTRNHARRLDPAEAARLRRSAGTRC